MKKLNDLYAKKFYKMALNLVILFVLLTFELIIHGQAVASGRNFLTVKMNNSKSEKPDDYKCSFVKLNESLAENIIGFYPNMNKKLAHHMILFGCASIPESLQLIHSNGKSWNCGEDGLIGVCGQPRSQQNGHRGGQMFDNIINAWTSFSSESKLPPNCGFRVGGDSGKMYLVVQMHYKNKFEEGQVDNSGVTVELTDENLSYQVAHYILGNYGYIPPLVSSYNLDSACQVELSFDMNPIGFRTHTHDLGVLSTGYHIRGNEWNLIGQLSPQKPQTFYEITNRNLTIRSNDILAARCTMNSLSRTSLTRIGPRNQDEMCNFYIMFYTSYMGRLDNIYCFRDAQKFHWPPRNQTN